MWQTQIQVLTGEHVPYFPGVDWDAIEHWDDAPGRGAAATEINKERGMVKREVVKQAMNHFISAPTKDIIKYCQMSASTVKHILAILEEEGFVFRRNVVSQFGQCNYWTLT